MMRKLLLGLALSAGIQTAWSDCTDTTFVLKAGVAGFTPSVTTGTPALAIYDPSALNTYIRNCGGNTMTLRINLDAAEAARTKDTVRLTGPIIIGGRANKITALSMARPAPVPAGTLDTLFTFVENGASPALLFDSAANTLVLSNMAFARKALNSGEHTVNINAKGSMVTGCHFWMADNNSGGLGALVNVGVDSVLVERSLFRAPPDGVGTSRAIRSTGPLGKIEIRSNVFQSTGVFMSISGPFHVIANTFVGSRNGNASTVGFNPIIIGNTIGTNFNNAVIMHNLFATKVDTLPPIVFNTASAVTSDSILRNAWARSKPNLPVAATEPPSSGITIRATGANANIPLPRGFSNYGPTSGDVKDYPLTQLRTDPTLARKHPDFGKLYKVFFGPTWAGTPTPISDILSVVPRMYFQSPTFVPFLGGTWSANLKVGAFANQDTVSIPSPLISGVQGAGIKLQRDSSSADKAKVKQIEFDEDYYKQKLLPEYVYFFFSNTLAKLASNDTTALLAANLGYRRQWSGFDSTLTVPKEVRTGGDIYVKMLHFRAPYMAALPAQPTAAIGTLSNFPGFPINDLTLAQEPSTSNFANRVVGFKVTRPAGGEDIDSIRILTLNEGGQVVGTNSVAAASGQTNVAVTVAAKGIYSFQAVPVAEIRTGVFQAGSPNGTVGPFSIGIVSSDSVYVQAKATGCPGTGEKTDPYCGMADALALIATRNGGTIIVLNASLPIDTLTIPQVAGDTSTLIITSADYKGSRPILRGTAAKEAVSIARKNVTLRGFTIEMPPSASKAALSIGAGGGGCLIDANIFRATSKGAVAAPAISVGVGATADARIVNNVVWAFSKGVLLAGSSSPNIKILFNTFVGDASLGAGATSGIAASGPEGVAAVVANNFFSELSDPIESSLQGKNPVLDHNVYTRAPDLHGHSEIGGLPASEPVRSLDIWSANYADSLKEAFGDLMKCGSLKPCNPLYAGSSANGYSVTVGFDVFGNVRSNRKEVGAFELAPGPSSVLGVLEIKAAARQGDFRKIDFSITGKSFDADSTEADSVQVFWTTSDVTLTVTPTLASIPAKQKKSYPIKKLAEGIINDFADSIDLPLTPYWFFAALSRNNQPPRTADSRRMGFAYSDSLYSGPDLSFKSCDFSGSKSACPSDKGVFGVDTGTWLGRFESRVDLKRPAEAGSVVKLPYYRTVDNLYQYGLDLTSPFPSIHLDAQIAGMEATPKQRMVWQVDFFFKPELAGKDLFLLPESPDDAPMLVPDWKIDSLGGGKYRLTFESRVDGPQTYAFGKLKDGVEPGTVTQSEPETAIYDFDVARDSTVHHVTIKFKGAGFKTANPLVLVSTIPAGHTMNPSAAGKFRVMSKDYPSKSLAITAAGYGGPDDSLRRARLHQLYMKARAADTVSMTRGLGKPFPLDSLTSADFEEATVLKDAPTLDLSAGDAAELAVKLPIGRAYFLDARKFQDTTGKVTRSLEVVFTIFDGSRVMRTRGFIRTRFRNDNIRISEWYQRQQFMESKPGSPHWNLFAYPWSEADTGSLARIVRKTNWDHARMRLMSYKGDGEGFSAYTPYDGTNPQDVPFDSGRAVWSGSVDTYTPQCAQGTSLDYQPFKLALSPGRYHDIGLPFNFPMKWQDILDTSLVPGGEGIQLWHFQDTARTWKPVTPATGSPSELVLSPWEGYTIKVQAPTTLIFPVADTSRILRPAAKPAAKEGSWVARVLISSSNAGMELRIGRGAREFTFPEAPDVPGQDFRVALAKDGENVSQFIRPMEGDWQGHWPIRGAAAKGSGGVSLRLGQATRKLTVWLADAVHGTAVPLSADQPVMISEGELASNDYHLVAGDRAYVDGLLQNLTPGTLLALTNAPNPFAGSTLIRYAMPAGFGKVAFDLKVRDFRGRTVWEKTIRGGSSLSYLWNGQDRAGRPLPAGIYTLSLSAKPEGKAVYRAVRKLMRM